MLFPLQWRTRRKPRLGTGDRKYYVDLSGVDQTALAWFHNCDLAKGLRGKSLNGQSGSKRQVNARTPEWLWREYKQHVGEGPVAVSGPLLLSLPDLCSNDPDGVFDSPYSRCLRTQIGMPTGLASTMELTKSVRKFTMRHFSNMVPT
jgi:hypothetical protein